MLETFSITRKEEKMREKESLKKQVEGEAMNSLTFFSTIRYAMFIENLFLFFPRTHSAVNANARSRKKKR